MSHQMLTLLLIACPAAATLYVVALRWWTRRKRARLADIQIVQNAHLDVPMPHGTIGLRTWPTKLAIVDLATNTVLASVDWIPRSGDFVKLSQSGPRFVVSVRSDPDDPDIPILSWTRPPAEPEETQ